jgi:demethylspheroidene O-methyltransferase
MPDPAAPAPRLGLSLSELWLGWRNRVLASPRFQRWAAAFPLTRSRAGREARALFDLCAGFVYTQVLSACVRLDLFERLRSGPRETVSLSSELGLTPEAARRLFRAAASLRLLQPLPNDRFALGPLGAAMLGNPSIGDFVRHHELLYEDLRDPVALLRGEGTSALSRFWPYAANRPGANGAPPIDEEASRAFARYSDLMSRSQALIAEDLLDAYPARRHRCWLDVGGGEGAFIAAAAARNRRLRFLLFDLAPVAARARIKLAQLGLESRVTVFEGDFLNDSLPQGADIVSLVRILHDHDDESARALLARAFAALPAGGTLLIAEPMAETPGGEPIGDAYFGFYLLAMGRGRARPPREIFGFLESAGFVGSRLLKTRRPMLASAIAARRP